MGYIHRRRSKIINKNTIELELKGSDLNGVFIWSEWGDLNPRPLGPEPSALPAALHPVSPPIIFPDGAAVKYNFPTFTCQIALAIRAPRIDFPAIVERHDADAEETEGGEDED